MCVCVCVCVCARTVSAAVRLMPRPPARVLNRNTKMPSLQGGGGSEGGREGKLSLVLEVVDHVSAVGDA